MMIMDRSNYKNNLTLLCEEASDSVLSDFIVVFVNGFVYSQMSQVEKLRRDLLCRIHNQAKPRFDRLSKRAEIAVLALRYHLPIQSKTQCRSNESKPQSRSNESKTKSRSSESKPQSKSNRSSKVNKKPLNSTSILVNRTKQSITTRSAYLIPSNTSIALKLTKRLIPLPELVPDHRCHHALTLRHDLHLVAVNPVVFAANDQLLSLLAVQNRSWRVVRSVRQKLSRHFRLFNGRHRPQENHFLSPQAAERIVVIQRSEQVEHFCCGFRSEIDERLLLFDLGSLRDLRLVLCVKSFDGPNLIHRCDRVDVVESVHHCHSSFQR